MFWFLKCILLYILIVYVPTMPSICVRWVTSADLEVVNNDASFVVVKVLLLFSSPIFRYTLFVLNLGRHIPRSSMILCRLLHNFPIHVMTWIVFYFIILFLSSLTFFFFLLLSLEDFIDYETIRSDW